MDTRFGPKTTNLQLLQSAQLKVPDFFPIDGPTIKRLWGLHQQGSSIELQRVAEQAHQAVQAATYAVRSSALLEDSGHSSEAGQFHTVVDVPASDLSRAIVEVMQQAEQKLGGRLELLSIIIQRYITADFSGVIFTRNPLGGREMLIEYHRGNGATLVSGQIRPDRISVLWDCPVPQLPRSVVPLASLVTTGKKIEQLFQQPQDIEWCVSGGKLWIVQARPITTITETQHQQYQEIDAFVAPEKNYYFEKTQLCEIAPRPTPMTFSILESLYAASGPIDQVYRGYGVVFTPQKFLRIIGNELFIDREAELHTLLPAYTYFGTPSLRPHPASFGGFFQSYRNTRKLAALRDDWKVVYANVRTALEKPFDAAAQLPQAFDGFLADYQFIFRANLLAEASWQKLGSLLKQQGEATPNLSAAPDAALVTPVVDTTNWQGNALEIADESPFVAHLSPSNDHVAEKLDPYVQEAMKSAATGARLREFGRWLTVRHISRLRQLLHVLAKERGVSAQEIYFAALPETIGQDIDQHILRRRQATYAKCETWQLPTRITSVLGKDTNAKPIGVSGGSASGKLITRDQLDTNGAEVILYTPMLTPDLVADFPHVQGIVSAQGGVLSHLAIMAREHHIPVIVNVELDKLGLQLGEEVEIDADHAIIQPQVTTNSPS